MGYFGFQNSFFFSVALTKKKYAPLQVFPHKIGKNWPLRPGETTVITQQKLVEWPPLIKINLIFSTPSPYSPPPYSSLPRGFSGHPLKKTPPSSSSFNLAQFTLIYPQKARRPMMLRLEYTNARMLIFVTFFQYCPLQTLCT